MKILSSAWKLSPPCAKHRGLRAAVAQTVVFSSSTNPPSNVKVNRSNSSSRSKSFQNGLRDGPKFEDFIRESVGDHQHSDSKTFQTVSELSVPSYPLKFQEETDASGNAVVALSNDTNSSTQFQTKTQIRKKSFYLETYGCQMNSADSEIVQSILLDSGMERTEQYLQADVILVNTCAIRENAEAKIWKRLDMFKAHKLKLSGQTRKRYNFDRPLPAVGVLGCMAERLKTKLLESEKMVDIVVGPDAYRDLPRLIEVVQDDNAETAVNTQLSLEETYADIAPVRMDSSSPSAYVSIMRGCNNMCSYCIVPFTRGRERSRPMDSIVDEVKRLRDSEVNEIVLLGQNVNSYNDRSFVKQRTESDKSLGRAYVSAAGFNNTFMGKSRVGNGLRFADLLEACSSVDPEIRWRFTSPHPKDFPDEVLDLIRDRHNICNSLHMPAQSGNSDVLQRMRRGYTREAYLGLVENVRTRIPGVALSSDFITGFCGELESEHLDTVTLMEQVCFDQAFMFAYSLRDKTHAAHRMKDDVEEQVKQRRLREIIDTFGNVVSKKNIVEDQDRYHVVLVEGTSKRSTEEMKEWSGRTDTNKRCIFPDAMMPSGLREWDSETGVHAQKNGLVSVVPGDYVLVKVHEAGRHTLKATPIARTSLVEVKEKVDAALLGARIHDRALLEL